MKKLIILFATCSALFIGYLSPVAASEWVWCANENELCRFDGRAEVSFGADRLWTARSAKNSIRCNNANFGDPAPGMVKSCFVRSSRSNSNDSVPSDWQHCASEGEFCNFRGRADVHYGAAGRWETRSARNGIFCGNETFGDPAPRRVKSCFISTSNANNESSQDEWSRCADENGFCEFDGWQEVLYGTNGRWTHLTRLNGTSCSNDIFGDPAPGRNKACYIRSR
jgi:hypothetical protein